MDSTQAVAVPCADIGRAVVVPNVDTAMRSPVFVTPIALSVRCRQLTVLAILTHRHRNVRPVCIGLAVAAWFVTIAAEIGPMDVAAV